MSLGTSDASMNSLSGTPGQQVPRQRHTGTKKVSRACLTCKERKDKCDGHWPCQTCIDRNILCRINPREDARTLAGRARNLDIATADDAITLLDRVKDFCQDEDKAIVQTLISKIQQYDRRPSTSTSAAVLDGTLQIVTVSHFTPTLAVETPGLVLKNESSHELSTYDRILQPPIDRSGDTSYGRRGLKRRAEDLGIRAEAFGTLLSSIRSADEYSLLQLRDFARDDRSIEELVRVTRDVLRSNELRTKNQIRLRQAVMSIGALIDAPPIRVPASPWTEVTDDDDAVSHLVSIYFTWQHHAYPSLNKDVFVEHMISRDLSSKFCSPFLVNCILMVACMYTDHRAAFADPKDSTTRAIHFLEEATRLWGLEEGRASLTNLQAFPSLVTSMNILGKDHLGSLYTDQCASLAKAMTKRVKRILRQGQTDESKTFHQSCCAAIRSAFMLQTDFCLAWIKPHNLTPPKIEAPYEESLEEVNWQPYPQNGLIRTPSTKLIADEKYHLYIIAAELSPFVLSGNPDDSPLPGYTIIEASAKRDGLHDIEQRLLKWYRDLHPACRVRNMGETSIAVPLVDLHLAYYGLVIMAQGVLLGSVSTADPEFSCAKDKIINASKHVASLFQMLQHITSQGNFGVYFAQIPTVCALNLVQFLAEPGVPDIFHILTVVMVCVSRRWIIVRGILRMIWATLTRHKVEWYLNAATSSLFHLAALKEWGPREHHLLKKCAYPNYAEVHEKGRDFVEMGDILQEYASMQISGSTEVDTPISLPDSRTPIEQN